MRRSAACALALSLLCAAPPVRAADNAATRFRKEWQDRKVTIQRTLFTLVFDERNRVGAIARGKREGITVATPSKGTFYLFTGRQSVDDITETDPDRLIDQVKLRYQRMGRMDTSHVQGVAPLYAIQYAKGIELLVRRVEIERSIVRLVLFKVEPAGEYATTLTIEWPTPLSADLQERDPLERVIRQFLMPQQ
jgi:hypothetical protein